MSNWYYHDPAQGRVGPIDADALRGHFREGRIQRDTLLWREGLREWQPLERLSGELGLDDELLSSTPPAPPPLPSSASAATAHSSPSYSADPGSSANPGYQPGSNPADAAAAHFNRRPTAPPPRRGLSGCVIVIIVVAALAIPVLGILAAIALPAYQDYTFRAKVSQAVQVASSHKIEVAEFVMSNDSCPDNDSEGFRPAADYADTHIASIRFGKLQDNSHCAMQIELRGIGTPVDGKHILQSLDPASGQWTCSSEIEKASLLPMDCRP